MSSDLSESELSASYSNYKQNGSSTKVSKDAASKFVKNGMRINNQIERYDTECDHGITAIKFHPFRDILYCADANGRVWVWKYESNIGANNPQNKRRINLVNIKDLHLSNAPLLSTSNAYRSAAGQRTPSATTSSYSLRSKLKGGHSQSVGHFPDTTAGGDSGHDPDRVVVTSFEIINEYHDTMLLCAGDDGTVRIYRNSHLENCMSAVTAFLANGRIKAPRSHSPSKDHHSSWNSGQMLTSWCSQFGYLYTGGSHNSIKVHDCHSESYLGNFHTKSNTTTMITGNKSSDKNMLIAGCTDNRIRIFDVRQNLNTATSTAEIPVQFAKHSSAKILSIKPTHKTSSFYYYVCSAEELLLFDLRSQAVVTRIPFKKYINTFDSHQYAPIYALGSTKQFVHICSALKLDSNARSSSRPTSKKQHKQQMQSVNEIGFHDGFLGARIAPVRMLKFHPFRLLLAVGGTDRHLSLYSSSKSSSIL